jgi:hypothetical protein
VPIDITHPAARSTQVAATTSDLQLDFLFNQTLTEFNNIGLKSTIRFNEASGGFERITQNYSSRNSLLQYVKNSFLPSGELTEDYYRYTLWRCCQRFLSATTSVFGAQALLLALGFKTKNRLGIAAATTWVLKDALGELIVEGVT